MAGWRTLGFRAGKGHVSGGIWHLASAIWNAQGLPPCLTCRPPQRADRGQMPDARDRMTDGRMADAWFSSGQRSSGIWHLASAIWNAQGLPPCLTCRPPQRADRGQMPDARDRMTDGRMADAWFS